MVVMQYESQAQGRGRQVGRLASRFRDSRYVELYILLLALGMSLVFVLFVYPRIAGPYNAVLDTDHYGTMGYGVWKNAVVSYYPDPQPSVNRGPVYPLFIAALLAVTNGWWPQGIQIAQCFLFALTCGLVFRIAERSWNRKVAVASALCCALHPFLIWYTSRIWIETLATFLFTALVAAVLSYCRKPSMPRALVLGFLLAFSTLCKGTFLPFLFLVPFLLAMVQKGSGRWRGPFSVLVAGVLFLAPWTLRNWNLTHRFIPVHVLAGFNFQVGDSFIENYWQAPFSYAGLWDRAYRKVTAEINSMDLGELPRPAQEAISDSALLRKSLQRYLEQPGFLLRKMGYNAVLYWTLGETRLKSMVISLMQIPLVLVFAYAVIRLFRREGVRSAKAIPVFMVGCYYGLHLPIFAFARLSVVLVPVMILYAMAAVLGGESA